MSPLFEKLTHCLVDDVALTGRAARYCSDACWTEARLARKRKAKCCETCGGGLPNPHRTFCSNKCRTVVQRAGGYPRKCPCGVKFVALTPAGECCSDACREKRNKAIAQPRKRGMVYELRCPLSSCGKVFQTIDERQSFCCKRHKIQAYQRRWRGYSTAPAVGARILLRTINPVAAPVVEVEAVELPPVWHGEGFSHSGVSENRPYQPTSPPMGCDRCRRYGGHHHDWCPVGSPQQSA
jgi:hypothetical protein